MPKCPLSYVAYEEIVLRHNNRLERLISDPEADFGHRPIEWLLLAVGTCFLYWPTLLTDAVGLALVGLAISMQITKNKKEHGTILAPKPGEEGGM